MRRELVAAGFRGRALDAAVRDRLAWTRRDLVWRQRFRRRRDHIDGWRFTEHNAGPVRELIAAGTSFIAAGGHFTMAATDLRDGLLPPGSAVMGAVPRFSWSAGGLRRRLDSHMDEGAREGVSGLQSDGKNLPALTIEMPDIWAPDVDWAALPPSPNLQDAVLAELANPGAVTQILIDAYWEKPGAYRRPFAGHADRGFALGAARLARLAQCPLVPFVAVLGREPRTVIYDWGEPTWPGPRDARSGDSALIDRALDFIEGGIARYPTQYLHPIGHARAWSHSERAWLARTSRAAVA
jgi:hypothetical protein